MKYAILSDVHANPADLEFVLQDIHAQGAEKIVFCGDITGYGYDAKGALAIVRRETDVQLKGNHDEVCVDADPPPWVRMNPNYDLDRAAQGQLDAEELAWLKSRPYVWATPVLACVHGDFTEPEAFNYVMSASDARLQFYVRPERLLFVGHTHTACSYSLDSMGRVEYHSPQTFELRRGCRYLVNVGSAGYPRNDGYLTYCLFDAKARKVEFRGAAFNPESYDRAMRGRGLKTPDWVLRAIS